jgi:hypothetical protein
MAVTNSLVYYDTAIITAVKTFILQATVRFQQVQKHA